MADFFTFGLLLSHSLAIQFATSLTPFFSDGAPKLFTIPVHHINNASCERGDFIPSIAWIARLITASGILTTHSVVSRHVEWSVNFLSDTFSTAKSTASLQTQWSGDSSVIFNLSNMATTKSIIALVTLKLLSLKHFVCSFTTITNAAISDFDTTSNEFMKEHNEPIAPLRICQAEDFKPQSTPPSSSAELHDGIDNDSR
mmetsp:Transcript_47680/g.55736  ORF Transcript_47680/g.55736 Transcript_47680/m.55736 type:complete len:200 (-) Transcript_47680:354-953(-)